MYLVGIIKDVYTEDRYWADLRTVKQEALQDKTRRTNILKAIEAGMYKQFDIKADAQTLVDNEMDRAEADGMDWAQMWRSETLSFKPNN